MSVIYAKTPIDISWVDYPYKASTGSTGIADSALIYIMVVKIRNTI
jgi:hypothetical protein